MKYGDYMILICYKKCSTCQKAKKHLQAMQVDFIEREIQEGVTKEELKQWIARSSKPIEKFFNTSGQSYRSNNYKEKLPHMSEEEKLNALANDAMLIKRPLFICDETVLVGYKQEEYQKIGDLYGKKQ